jgi:hypothetical protein
MKLIHLRLLCLLLMTSLFAKSQSNSTSEINFGAGIASYYGDLTQSDHAIFDQPSYAFSGGYSLNFTPHWSWISDIAFLKVQASDSKNSRADLRARNLSFKSGIWNVNTAAEYNIFDISDGRKFTPYVFLGIGLFHFNPYTTDRNGNKVYLQLKGTEGQGLAAYPDRQPYKLTQLEMPFGLGVKFVLNDNMMLQWEFRYHYIDTDYLDDVSQAGYPDQAVLAAKDPTLPGLTYRGDELPGGAPYPGKGAGLNRGNPNNRDSYYTTQIKFVYRLKSNKLSVNY